MLHMLKTTTRKPAEPWAQRTGPLPSFLNRLKLADKQRLREILNLGSDDDLPKMIFAGEKEVPVGLMIMNGAFRPDHARFPLLYLATRPDQGPSGNPDAWHPGGRASDAGLTCFTAYLERIEYGYLFEIDLIPRPPVEGEDKDAECYTLGFRVVGLFLNDLEHLPALLDLLSSTYPQRQIQLKDQYFGAKALEAPKQEAPREEDDPISRLVAAATAPRRSSLAAATP